MNRFFKKISIALVTVFTVSSCDNLLDINVDPGRISSDQVTVQNLLPSAIRFTANVQFGASQFGSQYPQYLGGQAISQYTPYGFDQLWRPLYTDALPTLQEIITRAEAQGAFNYSGIAKVMLAMNMLTASSIYGDLPYTQANRGTSLLNPCYDPMQDLYQIHIPQLIDSAIEDLQRPLPDLPTLRIVRNDYVYNGNLESWRRAAFALRARYNLQLSVKNQALLAAAAADVDQAFTGPTQDLELVYEANIQNPWWSFLGNPVNKTQQPTSYITNMMNGTAQYPGLVDPRLPLFMSSTNPDQFIGVVPGRLVGDDPAVNVNLTTTTWHSRNIAPLQMITYAEAQFIKAEALFSTNRAAAYEAYLNGIRGSMTKHGVGMEAINTYVNDPQISMGATNLQLKDIMLQKYIALYLQIETWNDMRRYQYDTAVYPGLAKPVINQIPGEPWIQRSNIADDEPGTNTCIPVIPNQGIKLWLFDN
ncbi:SusD/RagB family nutrient-binding outer membrane lipoprotein [Mongoliitalea daihaiensis]|uniref:SusD/RagB family nutrient-binding outer membrane lipoprotein n=1 Tax=Mongoliitalea daihaiensis TaxID=2782006 RepID=UPI001F2DF7D5|nr:SusD/RagB family nutrient-binding outer membrane lipoprotein [Mongoliitalea daihaiensis]UJP63696.1 SusD/RagB family nutrient-binding outer membrane lipoprotein [Mongoliitalea daihaiensis]